MQYFTFKPAAHLKSASTEMHDPEPFLAQKLLKL